MKPSFHIKTDTERNPDAVLLIIAGLRHCSFAVMDHLSKELVEFGYYAAIDTEGGYQKFLAETEILNDHYSQTAIAYDTGECLQIPSAIYNHGDGHLHLDAVYGRGVFTNTISEELPGIGIYNVYRIPADLHTAISRKFLRSRSWNIYSVLLTNYSFNDDDTMLVNFETDEFSLVGLKNKKLQLAKTFAYTSPEDVLYYLLKCCQQLDLSQQSVKLSLSGLIEKESAIYRELYKYFINVEFATLYGGIKLAEPLTAHPDHYYSSITKLAACVL